MALRLASVPDVLTDWKHEVKRGIKLWWLGQAGFLMKTPGLSIVIDPYLSDSLARKYAGTKFPHSRMMSPPVSASALCDVDAVFCSHRHTDHMDADTLLAIATASPTCRFIVPAAEKERALSLGIDARRLQAIDAGARVELCGDATVHAVPSAHEDLKVNENGQHHYLGFIVACQGRRIYHSGDCVPYPGLTEIIRRYRPDLALLPVNGRDEARRDNGVPGNFTLSEAITLAESADIPEMIGHHFGMFDFNTIDPILAEHQIASRQSSVKVHLAKIEASYWLGPVSQVDE